MQIPLFSILLLFTAASLTNAQAAGRGIIINGDQVWENVNLRFQAPIDAGPAPTRTRVDPPQLTTVPPPIQEPTRAPPVQQPTRAPVQPPVQQPPVQQPPVMITVTRTRTSTGGGEEGVGVPPPTQAPPSPPAVGDGGDGAGGQLPPGTGMSGDWAWFMDLLDRMQRAGWVVVGR